MTLPSPNPLDNAESLVKTIVIGLAVIVVFGLIGYLAYTKSVLEDEVKQNAEFITDLKNANQYCKKDIQDANQSIEKIKTDAEAQLAKSKKDIEQAQKQVAEYQKTQAKINAIKPTSDDCSDAKNLARQYFGGLKK